MAKTAAPAGLEAQLELYLVKKAPALPVGLKEFIVKFAPWLTLILMVLLLPVLLAALGLGALLLPASYLGGAGSGFFYTITLIGTGAVLVLEGLALPGLFKRLLSGWRLLFYATLINAIISLLGGNLISALVGALIGLYVLFQVKSYYH